MGELKVNGGISTLLDTYNSDVNTINAATENLEFTDSQNIMLENYGGMLDKILNTVGSYKQMVTTNVSSMKTVISELKEMDEDLQNNFEG
ncbi:hypothetical protein SAMN04487830_12215 [Pseudobutyrivibrio sp. OR37]|uniref:hypothetical protein n=1 Tax=Pseudobutyrivibrio sp. OR37 TaxID=1798186 RepID=UPI0008EC725C|nr:hypothetical protein [Pseudobutyrivibrio sp. OR37]SFI09598.1 hypothetical protein SAMN04487830_12215 [Pseudobutyrivibrio sp. OR37]